jgi:hypothetical protein
VLPGLQEAAAERFDEMLGLRLAGEEEDKSVSKPLAKDEGLNGRPHWTDSELVFDRKQHIQALQQLLLAYPRYTT